MVPVYLDYRRSKQQNSPCSRNAGAYSQRVRVIPNFSHVRTVSVCMIDLCHIYNVTILTNLQILTHRMRSTGCAVQLKYWVCHLRARTQLKTLSSLLKRTQVQSPFFLHSLYFKHQSNIYLYFLFANACWLFAATPMKFTIFSLMIE